MLLRDKADLLCAKNDDVGVVVVRAAKSQGLWLKEVGYIFYKACALLLERLGIGRRKVKRNVWERDEYIDKR